MRCLIGRSGRLLLKMMPQIDTRYLLLLLTIFVIVCAMFTQSPSLDDAAKITLGATLNALASSLGGNKQNAVV